MTLRSVLIDSKRSGACHQQFKDEHPEAITSIKDEDNAADNVKRSSQQDRKCIYGSNVSANSSEGDCGTLHWNQRSGRSIGCVPDKFDQYAHSKSFRY